MNRETTPFTANRLLFAIAMFARPALLTLFFLGIGVVIVPPSVAGPAVFESTGSLITRRSNHTATSLSDGKVLIAGGLDSGTLASAELYDPVGGTWTATGSLIKARYFHTATLLPDGKILAVGGLFGGANRGFGPLASAELYDPATGTWTATGSLTTARYFHTATLLPNGQVLVVGGQNTAKSFASAEVYDPTSGVWKPTGNLGTARSRHTAILLSNSKVLVAGGSGVNIEASAELYDSGSGAWTTTGNLTVARYAHTMTPLPDGQVLVAGGTTITATISSSIESVELYDPASGIWATTSNLGTRRTAHTATLLPNGKVLVAGGSVLVFNGDSEILASAELYDPASRIWTVTGSMAIARYVHTATLIPNGKVLVAGGGGTSGSSLAGALLYGGEPIPTANLLNISTRMRVQIGDSVLIGGFILTGSDPKRVIVRGIGPSLSQFISDALPDPVLELYQGNTLLVTNDNWKTDQQAEIEATGIAPTNDLESAIVRTLAPGTYTAIVRGGNDATGTGVVEAYDLDPGANSKLANISTRGFVETENSVMIGGLIVGGGGGGSGRVVVRALGPSIPLANPLADPTLALHDANGTAIASNDNWRTRSDGSSQQAEIEGTTIPPTNVLESALVRTLAPGAYTAIVRGKNNTIGIGLVEVYNLQ